MGLGLGLCNGSSTFTRPREFIESYCLPGCLLYTQQHPIVVKQIVFLIPAGLLLVKVCAIELNRLLLATRERDPSIALLI
jgi:hypothetical protein